MTTARAVSPPRPNIPHPTVAGKWLFVGREKLEVRGVTYGTFSANGADGPFPPPWRVRMDFADMAHAGFNAVRIYATPPRWLLDEAQEAGLRIMVGLPWEQHTAFLETRSGACYP